MEIFNTKPKSWVMWLPLALFFSYQYVMRLFPSIMADNIMSHFGIDATQFGLLAAIYYLGYAGMQVPIGILLDRFGPRYVTAFCTFICALGGVIFTFDSWALALIGRLLIGLGSAAALVSTSKGVRLWFPGNYFSRIVGITFTIGLLGAFSGGRPVAILMGMMNWESVILRISLISIVMGILILLIVRNKPQVKIEREEKKEEKYSSKNIFKEFLMVLKTSNIIVIALLGSIMASPWVAFTDVWGIPFLMQVNGWTKVDATTALSPFYLGMCIGAPILAHIAEKYDCYKSLVSTCALAMAVLFFSLIQAKAVFPMVILTAFSLGFFSAYQVLVLSIAVALVPKRLSATIFGFIQTINMSSGLIFPPLMGILLDSYWTGSMHEGVRIYSETTFYISFAPILLSLVVGFIGFNLLSIKKHEETRATETAN